MRIQHNIPAMNAYRNYNANTKALQSNLQKLSSGYKINKAGDDAAGLAISEKMRAQISGLEVAQKNAKDGISLVQTAEGAMTEIHTMLNRMFSLAEQSANGTYDNDVDRKQLNNEFEKLQKEIDRIADATNFNGKKLLNGNLDGPIPGEGDNNATEVAEFVATASSNAASLGTPTLEFATGLGEDDANDLNDALKAAPLTVTITNGTTSATTSIDAGDTIAFAGLDTTNYDWKMAAGTGGGEVTIGSTALTLGTNAATWGAVPADNGAFEIKIYKQGTTTQVGTLKFAQSAAAGNTGTTVFSFDEKANEITNATLESDDTQKGNLANFGITKIDFGTTAVAEGATVQAAFVTGDKLQVDVGGTVFEKALTTEIAAGGEVELTEAGGKKIKVTLEAGKLTANTPVAQAEVGKTAAASAEEGKGPLRLRVGDSVEKYDDIYVNIKSLKKDDLKTDLTKIKLGTKTSDDLVNASEYTDFDGTSVALSGLSVLTDGDADVAMVAIKDMINQVSTERGNLGATQNRLDHTINNLSTMQENIQDAEATIRDVDVAEEMMKYTKNNILVQSAQAMLAQANQLPQGVLQLLG